MPATLSPTIEQRLAQRERPSGRPVMYHRWTELLFVHWKFDPEEIQQTLPPGLTVDTYDGSAWIGVVPFFMRDIKPVWFPAVPGISNFQEINLRTYVCDRQGTPGVWFYSLDANCLPGVLWGRALYKLPYHWARMSAKVNPSTGHVDYHSHRRGAHRGLKIHFEYEPVGSVRNAEAGTLEFFLAERYILFSRRGATLYSGQVHHVPYPVQDARVEHWDDHLLRLGGLDSPGGEPDSVLCSRGVEVDVFPIRPV